MPFNWPKPLKNGFRFVDADVDGLDWMQGTYRPWRVSLHHDLVPPKPQEGCAAPTRSTASKTLFDPKMKGVGKAKNKGLKKVLERRQLIHPCCSAHNSTRTLAVSEGCRKAMRLLSAPGFGPEMTR